MTPGEQERIKSERQAWLDRFDPGARTSFFRETRFDEAVWLRAFSSDLGLPQEEAAPLLERTADERKWLKLKTSDGMCVGIAPFHSRRKRKPRKSVEQRHVDEEFDRGEAEMLEQVSLIPELRE